MKKKFLWIVFFFLNLGQAANAASNVIWTPCMIVESVILEGDLRRYNAGREANPVFSLDLCLKINSVVKNGNQLRVIIERFSLFPEQTIHINPKTSDAFNQNRHRVTGITTKPPIIGYLESEFSKYKIQAGIISFGGVGILPGQSENYSVMPIYQIVTKRYDTGIKIEGGNMVSIGIIRGDQNPLQGNNDKLVSNSYPGYFLGSKVSIRASGDSKIILDCQLVFADSGSNPGEKKANDSSICAVGYKVGYKSLKERFQIRTGFYKTRTGFTWGKGGVDINSTDAVRSAGNFVEFSTQYDTPVYLTSAYLGWNEFKLIGNKVDNYYWISDKSTSESEIIIGFIFLNKDWNNLEFGLSHISRNIPNSEVYGMDPEKGDDSTLFKVSYKIK